MGKAHRRHITLSTEALHFLERFQKSYTIPSFSATIEVAVEALKIQEQQREYLRFVADCADHPEEQKEAEVWLDLS